MARIDFPHRSTRARSINEKLRIITGCALKRLCPAPHKRFWRTLREGCLDFARGLASLDDINARLRAFVDEHYHRAPHASLVGRAPGVVFAEAAAPSDVKLIDETRLRDALTLRERRRVRRDTTITVDGDAWELDQGFLAGRVVTVARCLVAPDEPPWVEHEQRRYRLRPVDAKANARRKRPPRRGTATVADKTRNPVAFDPAAALVERAVRRRPKEDR